MASGSSSGGGGGRSGTGKPSSARNRALTRAKTSSKGIKAAPRSSDAPF